MSSGGFGESKSLFIAMERRTLNEIITSPMMRIMQCEITYFIYNAVFEGQVQPSPLKFGMQQAETMATMLLYILNTGSTIC